MGLCPFNLLEINISLSKNRKVKAGNIARLAKSLFSRVWMPSTHTKSIEAHCDPRAWEVEEEYMGCIGCQLSLLGEF